MPLPARPGTAAACAAAAGAGAAAAAASAGPEQALLPKARLLEPLDRDVLQGAACDPGSSPRTGSSRVARANSCSTSPASASGGFGAGLALSSSWAGLNSCRPCSGGSRAEEGGPTPRRPASAQASHHTSPERC
jgi:hypothetical protein